MTKTNACNTTKACGAFNLDGVNFGNKSMSDIMAASQMGQKWATNILTADQKGVQNYHVLNSGNTQGNTYGALRLGIQASYGFQSADATVNKKLGEWMKALNAQFPGVSKYAPEDLLQQSSDLTASADCIEKNTQKLISAGEFKQGDANYLKSVVAGLRSLSANLQNLHKAVCAGPDIECVTLDIAPKYH